ncbi:hypothetical protein [uncultured Bacteroides sp.]|uniref:tetratricopeptide repeat protein n=1 Tax=uncultured Bacteroides sp. TaxID=162156 RepID=UPI00263845E7|nr:hypothetical protein [uncultured Bacteroides sp.]
MKTNILFLMTVLLCSHTLAAQSTNNDTDVIQSYKLSAEYYQKGDSLEKNFDYYGALRWYKKSLETDYRLLYIRKIAQCYMKRGQYGLSKLFLNKIPADSLTQMDLRFKYNLHKQMSERDSMLLVGKRIIDEYPFDSEIIASLASAYNIQEQPDSALSVTEKYVSNDSTNVFINRQRAFSFYLKNEYEKALSLYRKLLFSQDNSGETYYYTGLCYAKIDSLNQAYDNFVKANQKKRENPYILSQLGLIGIKIGFKDEGIKYIQKAITLLQPDTTLMFALNEAVSDAYFSRHKYRESICYLNRCLEIVPSSLFSIYKIARIYGILKDTKKEKLYYQRFVNSVDLLDNGVTEVIKRSYKEAQNRLQAIKEEEFFKYGIPK